MPGLIAHLLRLEGLGLSTEVGRGRASALEEAGEERLEEGVEDDGSTAKRNVLVVPTL